IKGVGLRLLNRRHRGLRTGNSQLVRYHFLAHHAIPSRWRRGDPDFDRDIPGQQTGESYAKLRRYGAHESKAVGQVEIRVGEREGSLSGAGDTGKVEQHRRLPETVGREFTRRPAQL